MSENVVRLVLPTEPTPADDVVAEAASAGLRAVVIVGYDANEADYYNSSMTDAPTAIYLLQRAIHRLNCVVDKGIEGE